MKVLLDVFFVFPYSYRNTLGERKIEVGTRAHRAIIFDQIGVKNNFFGWVKMAP